MGVVDYESLNCIRISIYPSLIISWERKHDARRFIFLTVCGIREVLSLCFYYASIYLYRVWIWFGDGNASGAPVLGLHRSAILLFIVFRFDFTQRNSNRSFSDATGAFI